MNIDYSLRQVGFLHSRLIAKEGAAKQSLGGRTPKHGWKIDPAFRDALHGTVGGQEVILLTNISPGLWMAT